jgi:hypothetical protein
MPTMPNGLAALFPGMRFAMPGAQQFNYSAPPPDDGRTNYTGTIGADQYDQAGNVNQRADPMNGAKLGPPRPLGGQSQLVGHPYGVFSGYTNTPPPGYVAPTWDWSAGEIDGRPLSGPNGPLAPNTTPKPNEPPRATPKPNEPPPRTNPMMGQWGGGGWNVGSGAPASMQQMWLGSMNGGQSWGQAPGYNSTAPQAGQTTPMWSQAKNQDADSPTWVQR